jgi:cytochrome c-type biogenesis protein CcmH/NrfG
VDFISITRELSKLLPDFVGKGSLMLLPPAKDLLRGIYFESSVADKRSFYVTVFVLPLFVPTDHIYLNLGERIGISWNADDKDLLPELAEVLRREALPFLNSVGTLEGLTEALIHNSPDARTQQAMAYGLAVKGDIEQALVALDLLILSLEVEFPWQQSIKDQAQALRTALTENPSLAKRWLQTWEAETTQRLGLEKFR